MLLDFGQLGNSEKNMENLPFWLVDIKDITFWNAIVLYLMNPTVSSLISSWPLLTTIYRKSYNRMLPNFEKVTSNPVEMDRFQHLKILY